MFLFSQFLKYLFQVLPVEADMGGAAGQLVGFQYRRKRTRDATEDGILIRRALAELSPLGPRSAARSSALICSQFFSTAAELAAEASPKTCGWRRTIFEWMDSITSETVNLPGFFGQDGVENHLQQQVTQFPGKFARVGGLHRVENLVGFLDQELAERIVGLLAVPGAAAGSIEPRLQGDQLGEPFAGKLVSAVKRNQRFGGAAFRFPLARMRLCDGPVPYLHL